MAMVDPPSCLISSPPPELAPPCRSAESFCNTVAFSAPHGRLQPKEGSVSARQAWLPSIQRVELEPAHRRLMVALDRLDRPGIASLLQGEGSISECKFVHDHVIRIGLEQDTFLGSLLVSVYGKYGALQDARFVFDRIEEPNIVSWTAMLTAYAQKGFPKQAIQLLEHMYLEGVKPNTITFIGALSACAGPETLAEGQLFHACIVECGFDKDLMVGTALLKMYSNCGALEDGRAVFDTLNYRDVVSWTAMIAGYVQQGFSKEALRLFRQMQQEHVNPNKVTFTSVLSACASLADLAQGRVIHSSIAERELHSDNVVGTALVNMYAKCGALKEARCVFDQIRQRDVVSWTTMISIYSQQGHAKEALQLFQEMRQRGVKPNKITFIAALSACAMLESATDGQAIHASLAKDGYESDVTLGNALLHMYGKSRDLIAARSVFDKMLQRDVVSWTTMMTAYVKQGHEKAVLEFYRQMQREGVKLDEATFISVLSACGGLLALGQGRLVHAHIVSNGIEPDGMVGTALVKMYGKCGALEVAWSVFDGMSQRDQIAWTAIITAYAQEGQSKEALKLFEQMKHEGVMPDEVTFAGLLSSCSHEGLTDDAAVLFASMSEEYGIPPAVEHYGCMIDILGRAGHLEAAEEMINKSPYPSNACMWSALLGACRKHGDVERGLRAAKNVMILEPQNAAPYVLLSNIYAADGRGEDAQIVISDMVKKGLKKKPGCSLVEVDNRVHQFVASDGFHSEKEAVYEQLENLDSQVKEIGYVPNLKLVLHDVEEELKDYLLGHHSERLAVAFGLISTSPGTPIRVAKNLRMCPDCHIVMKLLSKIVGREIIVRDANRIHHFNHGLCSCCDFS